MWNKPTDVMDRREKRSYGAPVWLCLVLIAVLLLLSTGYEGALQYQTAERCVAEVVAVDDSLIIDTGLVRSGDQICTLHVLTGQFRGRTITGANRLRGSLAEDKIYAAGDRALVVISHEGDEVVAVTMTDHFRLNWEVVLAVLFAVLLILFAGSCMAIRKLPGTCSFTGC